MDPSILAGIAGAAPGIAQGGKALYNDVSNNMGGFTQSMLGAGSNQLNTLDPSTGIPVPGSAGQPDPLTAAVTNTAPTPAAPATAPANGGKPVQGVGGLGALAGGLASGAGGLMGLQGGGVVPQSPVPQSGIVPASTQGQVLTFDQGGIVPGGSSMSNSPDFQQAQGPQVSYPTPGAGFVSGFAAGQGIGRNLLNAWHEHSAQTAAINYANAADQYNPNSPSTPADSTNTSPIGHLQDSVENFFTHLHNLTLGANDKPNHAQGLPGDPDMTPISGSGPQSAVTHPDQPPAQAIPASPGGAPPAAPATQAAGPAPAGQPGNPVQPGAGGPPAQMGGDPTAPPPGSPAAQQAGAAAAQKGQALGVTAAAVADGKQQSQQDQAQGQPNASAAPHSLGTDDYDALQRLKMKAVASAIRAGKDPNTVYQSMNQLETAHFQTQITRYMSNAQAALQHGDMDGVKKSLANANYYLPNGQDINMKTATADDVAQSAKDNGGVSMFKPGDLMVQSPTYGISGHQGPEWQPVTMQTLQLEGQNLLDPTKVGAIISGTYTAQSEANYRTAQGRADLMNAQAHFTQAAGIKDWRESQAEYTKASTAARIRLMGADANDKQADALKKLQDTDKNPAAGRKVPMGAVNTAQQQAAATFDKNMQGQIETDQRGTAATNPNFGKPWRNPDKQNPTYTGLTPAQASAGRGLAQSIAAANVGDIGSEDAANIAAQAVRWQSPTAPSTHSEKDPVSGKMTTYKNYAYDADKDLGHVWFPGAGGGHWRNFRLKPNIADPSESSPVPTAASSGSGDQPPDGSAGDVSNEESGESNGGTQQ